MTAQGGCARPSGLQGLGAAGAGDTTAGWAVVPSSEGKIFLKHPGPRCGVGVGGPKLGLALFAPPRKHPESRQKRTLTVCPWGAQCE